MRWPPCCLASHTCHAWICHCHQSFCSVHTHTCYCLFPARFQPETFPRTVSMEPPLPSQPTLPFFFFSRLFFIRAWASLFSMDSCVGLYVHTGMYCWLKGTLSKPKQQEEFIERVSTCQPGNSRQRSNEFDLLTD